MKPKRPLRPPAAGVLHRVLIVDDHPYLRIGLTETLGKESGLTVCAAVGTAEEALDAVEKFSPDIVVTDLNLPGKSGLELIKDLAALRPGLPVIALSMHDEEVYAERCVRAGARGYVAKSENTAELVGAIWRVLDGGVHISAKSSARIVKNLSLKRRGAAGDLVDQLSDREFEVFQWLGRGESTGEIANRMHISVKTVETHRIHIKAKLNLSAASEVIAYAARWSAVAD